MIANSAARLLQPLRIVLLVAVLAAPGFLTAAGHACSEFILPPAKTTPAIVSARTLEFPGVNSEWWDVSWKAVERNKSWVSGSSTIGTGKQWTNQYGFVGITAAEWLQKLLGETFDVLGTGPLIMDGLNEHGLSASFLWLTGTSLLQWEDKTPKSNQLLWIHTVDYILGKFQTVAEVRKSLSDPNSPDYAAIRGLLDLDSVLSLHVVVHDRTGASMLIEWTDRKQHIYTKGKVDEYGVVTNEPPWPTMVLEIPKYKKAKPTNEMLGLLADHTPKSRFAKLVKLRHYARMRAKYPQYVSLNPYDAAVQDAAQLINCAYVIRGTDDPDPIAWTDNFTGPTLIRDHIRKIFYFKGYNNQSYRRIELAGINFEQSGLSNNSLAADPNPDNSTFYLYKFSQDVTPLLVGAATPAAVAAGADQQTLSVTFTFSDQDLVKLPLAVQTGNLYIYAVTSNQGSYQWSDGRWTSVAESLLTPVHTGGLTARTFQVALDGLPGGLDAQRGTRIYAGYGATSTEMFLANRQQVVYTIGAERSE